MHHIETRTQLEEFKTVVEKLPRVLQTIRDKELELLKVERAARILASQRHKAIETNRTYTPSEYIEAVTTRLNQATELSQLQSQCKSLYDDVHNYKNWIKTYVPCGIWFTLENFVFGIARSSGKVYIIPQYHADGKLPELGGNDV